MTFSLDNVVTENVVPDAIDELPKHGITITYENGLLIEYGNTVAAYQVKHTPRCTWTAEAELYTLIMVDIDHPESENPIWRDLCHYLVVNIPGPYVSKGEVIAEYLSPWPRYGTHRYVFMVYKQKREGKLRLDKISADDRESFDTREWVLENDLDELHAVNFFHAQKRISIPDDHIII